MLSQWFSTEPIGPLGPKMGGHSLLVRDHKHDKTWREGPQKDYWRTLF